MMEVLVTAQNREEKFAERWTFLGDQTKTGRSSTEKNVFILVLDAAETID